MKRLAIRMSAFLSLALCAVFVTVATARSEAAHSIAPGIDGVFEALQIERLTLALEREGREYAAQMADEMFGDDGGTQWAQAVDEIYAPARMQAALRAALLDVFAPHPDAATATTAFFTSEPGARIVALEIAAREALMDESVKDAAELAFSRLSESGGSRLQLIEQFVAINDLIESNVASAMNANFAFFLGIIEGGAGDELPPEDELIADIWSQEDDIRGDLTDWLFPYLTMAYQPLIDDDLERYIGFSDTPEGRILNRALFVAFDALFSAQSRGLGLAASQIMLGQDI